MIQMTKMDISIIPKRSSDFRLRFSASDYHKLDEWILGYRYRYELFEFAKCNSIQHSHQDDLAS